MIINIATEPVFEVQSYVIEENGHCILIDPIDDNTICKFISNLTIDFILLTHEHFDHIRGVNTFRKKYKTTIMSGKTAEDGLKNPSVNMSRYLEYLVEAIPFGNHKINFQEFSCSANLTVEDNQIIKWQGHNIFIKETPGHSKGSISILIDNKSLFSGDTIFENYPTATKMPGGNTKAFKTITEPWLNSLPQDIVVYPGHTKPFVLINRFK